MKWMSIGYFAQKGQALIWRGPMACNALKQMILQVRWGELDYLLIDMPPGTGDIHISLIQDIPVDGPDSNHSADRGACRRGEGHQHVPQRECEPSDLRPRGEHGLVHPAEHPDESISSSERTEERGSRSSSAWSCSAGFPSCRAYAKAETRRTGGSRLRSRRAGFPRPCGQTRRKGGIDGSKGGKNPSGSTS